MPQQWLRLEGPGAPSDATPKNCGAVKSGLGRWRHKVLSLDVKAPPMVGPTWTRVRLTLGSDCLPTLSQGTILLLPSLSARVCSMSDVRDLGVVLVCLIHLVIMCVGARLHGILYPMTGCVPY